MTGPRGSTLTNRCHASVPSEARNRTPPSGGGHATPCRRPARPSRRARRRSRAPARAVANRPAARTPGTSLGSSSAETPPTMRTPPSELQALHAVPQEARSSRRCGPAGTPSSPPMNAASGAVLRGEHQRDVADQAEHERGDHPRLRSAKVGAGGRGDQQDQGQRLEREFDPMLVARDRHPVADRDQCGQDRAAPWSRLVSMPAGCADYRIEPGLRMPSRIQRVLDPAGQRHHVRAEVCRGSHAFFSRPTPCSPVIVPPSAERERP